MLLRKAAFVKVDLTATIAIGLVLTSLTFVKSEP
jgi:hypothetical protein